MPHARIRYIFKKILKKLKYSPIVAIQGARQIGKSFLVREFLVKELKDCRYLTFDQESVKESAKANVEFFLEKNSDVAPLIIDEAQKVPKIFDALKFSVDTNRRPGKYVILGSTEFSKMTLITENLTGRISRIRLYPLTISELNKLVFSHETTPFYLSTKSRLTTKELIKYLETGGLPGLFAIRSMEEKRQLIQDWLSLTLNRDLHEIPKLKLDSQLAKLILTEIAKLDNPSAGEIAKTLNVDLRKIKTHLSALETLFIIQPLNPHSLGTGKPLYYIFDVGLANFLGASLQRQLETSFYQNYLAKKSFSEKGENREIYFFRSSHGNFVNFIEEEGSQINALQIFHEGSLKKIHFYGLSAFKKIVQKKPKVKVKLFALASNIHQPSPRDIQMVAWEHMG